MLQIGDLAPDFIIKSKDNKSTRLSSLNSELIVLFFYPKSDTPGCTIEATEFSESHKDFERLNTYIVGISKDNVAMQTKFQQKHNLTVLLGSDNDSDICEKYGVWIEKNMYGKKYFGISRTTLLIDKQRKIINIWTKVKPKGHAKEILSFIKEFHT